MGLFDEQIIERKQSDQEAFEDSLFEMAGAITGARRMGELDDGHIITKDAIDDILKYYHIKPAEIPEGIEDPDEQLEYALRPHGFMHRVVELKENWYSNAYGPMIAYMKESGMPVAVYPGAVSGYYFRDMNGVKKQLNKKTAELFETDSICFYRPLPQKPLGVKDLMLYMKQCLSRYDFGLLIGMMVVCTLIGMLLPKLTRLLTGFVLESGNVSILFGTAVFILCVSLSYHVINACSTLATARINVKTGNSVESAIMMRILSLPASFFKKCSSGELNTRRQSMTMLCTLLVNNVFSVSLTSLISLLYVTQIFSFAPALTLPAIMVVLCTLLISIITTMAQMRITKEQMELNAKANGVSFAIINGIQKIKLAGAEKRAFAKWAKGFSESVKLQYNPPLFLQLNTAITMAISVIGTAVIYYIAVTTNVSPAEYIAFNVSYGMVTGAFTSLAGIAITVAQIKPILELADPILKAEPEASDDRKMVTSISGSIELNNVYFRYNENMPYVVDGMNLKIRPGEYIAIVGRTGCGKSTLIRLLLGFESPQKGAVYYDGRDISRMELRSLRRQIGAVTQDGSLFTGDIFSNIVISAPQLTLDDAWEAAEIAGIADDIRAMPMGMHTIVSEGQGGFSGGQKQRLMIARAIAPKPRILIFDEATSALDNESERYIQESLDKLAKGRTTITIAHRLSTILGADEIIVLDEDGIKERGKHKELILKGGLYEKYYRMQLGKV